MKVKAIGKREQPPRVKLDDLFGGEVVNFGAIGMCLVTNRITRQQRMLVRLADGAAEWHASNAEVQVMRSAEVTYDINEF